MYRHLFLKNTSIFQSYRLKLVITKYTHSFIHIKREKINNVHTFIGTLNNQKKLKTRKAVVLTQKIPTDNYAIGNHISTRPNLVANAIQNKYLK